MPSLRVPPDVRPPFLAAVLLTASLPSLARANDPTALPELGLSLFRVAGSLALVLALVFALAALYRRARSATRFGRPGPRLETLDRLDLGARREIRLIRAGGRSLVVGITDTRLDLLTELEDDSAGAFEAPALDTSKVRALTISS